MNPRTEYEMTPEDLNKILEACKPTPCIMIGGYTGSTPQENANRAWEELGKRMGFDSMTVRPIEGKSARFFTAVPSETGEQRAARLTRKAEESRLAEIKKLEHEIEDCQKRLAILKDTKQNL